MKVFILGSTGMLGKYVTKYLNQFYDVVEVNRNLVDASTITQTELRSVLCDKLGLKKDDVIINCMGTIKPRVDELGDRKAIMVNSIFPRTLADVAEDLGAHMIHPTTDCVYLGLKGSYDENDKYDVHDVYGMSKALGEPSNCTVVRTSIIGEEVGQTRSLVEWIKSNANNTVFGFTNHFWNGVTCLQFAKICQKIIERDNFWKGIKHVHSNTLTKKELVETISEVYGLNITVTPKETPVMCDRSLSTIYNTGEIFDVPSLRQQIIEMREFSPILNG